MTIKKEFGNYILYPPEGIEGTPKKVAWEFNSETIEIEKTWELGQIFAYKKRFLGLPAINKEAIIAAYKENKKYVRIKINKSNRQGIIIVPITEWIKDSEEKNMIYHNPKSTDNHCSGYDDQYVLPKILYDRYATGVAEEIKKEIWKEVGTPEIEKEKIQNEVIKKIKGGQQKLW